MAKKVISLRVPTERLGLIERAAAIRGQSRNEFMIDSACSAATAALRERRLFELDDPAYTAFVDALNAPANPNERLRSLLQTKDIRAALLELDN